MGTKCIDCGEKVKNRSIKTKRCYECNKTFKRSVSRGRALPFCKTCGKKISAKVNKTGLCGRCYMGKHVPWNKGITGIIPWNKGVSKFASKEEYRTHSNKLRAEKRKKEQPHQRIADRIRTLIRNQIRKYTTRRKGTKTEILLGCSPNYFIKYLESLFLPDMSWNNYGNGQDKWNIDHIVPVSKFNLSDIEEQKRAFHFTNCRPMWAIENIRKGNRAAATLTATVTY